MEGPISTLEAAQGSHQSFAFGVIYIIVDPVTKALAKGHEAKSLPANVQRLKARLSVVMSSLPSSQQRRMDMSHHIHTHTHTHTHTRLTALLNANVAM